MTSDEAKAVVERNLDWIEACLPERSYCAQDYADAKTLMEALRLLCV
jgi:hypothetical protein